MKWHFIRYSDEQSVEHNVVYAQSPLQYAKSPSRPTCITQALIRTEEKKIARPLRVTWRHLRAPALDASRLAGRRSRLPWRPSWETGQEQVGQEGKSGFNQGFGLDDDATAA